FGPETTFSVQKVHRVVHRRRGFCFRTSSFTNLEGPSMITFTNLQASMRQTGYTRTVAAWRAPITGAAGLASLVERGIPDSRDSRPTQPGAAAATRGHA